MHLKKEKPKEHKYRDLIETLAIEFKLKDEEMDCTDDHCCFRLLVVDPFLSVFLFNGTLQ